MIKKSKEIIRFIKLVNTKFGSNYFTINDQWDSLDAVGLQKGKKLIYIAYYNKNDYFFECSLITDNPEIYIIQSSDNATEEQLLEVISKFFEIKKKI